MSFLSIIGFVGILSKKLPKLVPLLPLFACTSIITLLYVFSFTPWLFWISKLILFSGLLSLVYCLGYILHKQNYSPKKIFDFAKTMPGTFWLFLLVGVAWFFFTRAAVIHIPDEFFWALYAKFIYFNHGFSGIDGRITDYGINYPPAAPLFQHFFLQLGHFSENALYFAQGVVTFSALSAIFVFKRKKPFFIFMFSLCFVSALSYFLFNYYGFLAIISDNVMGIIFGATLLLSLSLLKSARDKLFLIPIIFALTLFKENGIVFALVIALFNIIDLAILYYKRPNGKLAGLAKLAKVLLVAIIVGLTPLVAYGGWQVYLRSIGTHSNLSVISLGQDKEINTQVAPADDQPVAGTEGGGTSSSDQPVVLEEQATISEHNTQRDIDKLIISNFSRALVTKKLSNESINNLPNIMGFFKRISPGMSNLVEAFERINRTKLATVQWLAIIVILFLPLILVLHDRKDKIRMFTMFCVVVFGLFIYLASLLFAYLMFFPAKDAIGLTAIVRYINSYMIGALIAVFGLIAVTNNELLNLKIQKLNLFLLVFVLALFVAQTPPVYALFIPPSSEIAQVNAFRSGLRSAIEAINKNTSGKDMVFLYIPLKKTEQSIMKYELFPRKTSVSQVNLIASQTQANVWEPDINPAEVVDVLKSGPYRYFFIDRVDDAFWQDYSVLFENVNESKKYRLFKVTKDKNKDPYLTPFIQ